MSMKEFLAWLEGFEHSFYGQGPTLAQWLKIKDKLEQVSKTPPPAVYREPNLWRSPSVLDTPLYPTPIVTCGVANDEDHS